jgi:hypothetical protein
VRASSLPDAAAVSPNLIKQLQRVMRMNMSLTYDLRPKKMLT